MVESFHVWAAGHRSSVALLDLRPSMYRFARFLQLVGLAIPPLAMVAQLQGDISAGKMLSFLFVAVGLFLLGYGLQRHRGHE